MSVTAPVFQTLEAALNDLGQAWVLVGDPFTTSGLSVLGLTPGDITVSMNPQYQASSPWLGFSHPASSPATSMSLKSFGQAYVIQMSPDLNAGCMSSYSSFQ